MKELEKYIVDEKTGLKYELVGDYYFLAGDDETEEQRPIGIWGQRHLSFLSRYKKSAYMSLLTEGKLEKYLSDVNEEAEEMYGKLIRDMAKREGVTEQLKADDQMEWVRRMNSIRNRATEIVNSELIYN